MNLLDGKLFGFELEFFLIDNEGKISNRADEILNSIKPKHTDLKRECGNSMIELATTPQISARSSYLTFLEDFQDLLFDLEKKDLGVYYYGTYPSINANKMRENTRYKVQERILGKSQFLHAGRCIGFHFHHSLPGNVFDPVLKFFHEDITLKQKKRLTNLHNFYVSIDPALATFMQSSPYYENKYMGKDARLMVYRGSLMKESDYLYSKYPNFGSLNNYHLSFDTLLDSIRNRFDRWEKMLFEQNTSPKEFAKKEPSILDSSWKPVKLTAHGTIESRGCDMNSPSNIFSLVTFLKHSSRMIIEKEIDVTPIKGETKIKLEDNILYVPEMSEVKSLEKKSARNGLKNKEIRNYCRSVLKLADNFTSNSKKNMSAFETILGEGETVSDKLIRFVKNEQGNSDFIEKEIAEKFALREYDKLFRDIVFTKKMVEKWD